VSSVRSDAAGRVFPRHGHKIQVVDVARDIVRTTTQQTATFAKQQRHTRFETPSIILVYEDGDAVIDDSLLSLGEAVNSFQRHTRSSSEGDTPHLCFSKTFRAKPRDLD